jgi:hypothetical protein
MTAPNSAPPPPDPRIEEARLLSERLAAIDTRINDINTDLPKQAAAEQEAEQRREALYDEQLERGVEIGQLAVQALTEGADWVHYKAAGLPSNPNREHEGRQQLHGTIPGAETRRYARERDIRTQDMNGYTRTEDHSLFHGWTRKQASLVGSWIARNSGLSDPLVVTTKHPTIEHQDHRNPFQKLFRLGHDPRPPRGPDGRRPIEYVDPAGHYHYGEESPHREAHAHRGRRGPLHRPDAVAVVGTGLVHRFDYTQGNTDRATYQSRTTEASTSPEYQREEAVINAYRTVRENAAEEARDRLRARDTIGLPRVDLPDAASARAFLPTAEHDAEKAEQALQAAIAAGANRKLITALRDAAFRDRNLANSVRTASYERPAPGADNPTPGEILDFDQRLIDEAGGLGGQYYEAAGPRRLTNGLVGNVYQEVANEERWRHGLSTEMNDLVLGVDDSRRAERQQELASVDAELQATRRAAQQAASNDPNLAASLATFDAAEYRRLADLRREAHEARDRAKAILPGDPDYAYYQTEAADAQATLVKAEGNIFHTAGFDTLPDAAQAPILAERREIANARRDIAELDTRRTELQTMLGTRDLDRRLRPDGNGGETSDFRTLAELANDMNRQLLGAVTLHAAIDASLPRMAIHERRKQILNKIDNLRRVQPVRGHAAGGLQRTYIQAVLHNQNYKDHPDPVVKARKQRLYENALGGLGVTNPAELTAYFTIDPSTGQMTAPDPNAQAALQARSDDAGRRIAELEKQTVPLDRRLALHTKNDTELLPYQQAELGQRVIAAGADRDAARVMQMQTRQRQEAAEQARVNALNAARQLEAERLQAQRDRHNLEQQLNAIPPQFHP